MFIGICNKRIGDSHYWPWILLIVQKLQKKQKYDNTRKLDLNEYHPLQIALQEPSIANQVSHSNDKCLKDFNKLREKKQKKKTKKNPPKNKKVSAKGPKYLLT